MKHVRQYRSGHLLISSGGCVVSSPRYNRPRPFPFTLNAFPQANKHVLEVFRP